MLSRQRLLYLATAGSIALLAGAFLFQFLGWAPCKLCLWQRWPHVAAAVIGAAALTLGSRALAALGAVVMIGSAGLAAYHTGVERRWWDGPTSCTGPGPLLGDGASLLPTSPAQSPALVMCDQLQPFFLGLTMANWNLVWSLALAGLWIAAARRAV